MVEFFDADPAIIAMDYTLPLDQTALFAPVSSRVRQEEAYLATLSSIGDSNSTTKGVAIPGSAVKVIE